MSEQDELKETTVSEDVRIDALKIEEKQKLVAAEETYANKQEVSAVSTAPSAEADQPQRSRNSGSWIPGLILIGLGAIFLLNNVTGLHFDNWWALFILIPAFGSFSKAADSLRQEGEFTRDAWGAMAGGIIFTLVAAAFLFNLDWGLIWPVFLIVGGLGLLLGGLKKW